MFRLPHDRAIFAQALLAGLPAIGVALATVWRSDLAAETQTTATLGLVGCWLGFAAAAQRRAVRPLQTMANILLALRQGDFSFRARNARRGDPLGDLLVEINELGDLLQSQRRGAVEATTLLRTVMAEIDVAIFAFDQSGTLRLVNSAGAALLAQPDDRLLGQSACAVGLAQCLEGEATRVLAGAMFPGKRGRWGLRRTAFRDGGRPHQLLVIADLSQPLREEELKAWQRLVRVLGHELNNSLAPIKSIAGTLGSAVRRSPRAPDWEEDLRAGLDVIAARADSLSRFMQAYAQFARLPPPTPGSLELAPLAARVAALEARLAIAVAGGPALGLPGDAAQIEQALINLVKNATDAALEQRAAGQTEAGVRLSWRLADRAVEIRVEDDGPGVGETANLFVPFFTTKAGGSGIGLVLSRQIAENHGGSLELRNRRGANGCVAILRLPVP